MAMIPISMPRLHELFEHQEVEKDPASTNLEHLSRLTRHRPDSINVHVRKTDIICTIGPASQSIEMLVELMEHGMNIARLNFSHGDHEYHAQTIRNIREAAYRFEPKRSVGIALDTKGPEIRTGFPLDNDGSEIKLVKGDFVRLTTDPSFENSCTATDLYIDYKTITKVVKPGARLFIDDGLISLLVDEIGEDFLRCIVENDGKLDSRKRVTLPGTHVDLPAVSEKDKLDLEFGVKQGVDMIFASFIRDGKAIKEIRSILGEKGKDIQIIAKIENQQGLDNADDIIREADGIMVARGDLGIEIGTEKVFLAQKMLIAKCNIVGKSVICATQMLESMINKPRPTRAEGSDVANAVLDGADCLMLSGETAKGEYPVEALQIMHHICQEAESAFFHSKFFDELFRMTPKPLDELNTIAIAAISAAVSCSASAIVLLTDTGRAPKLCSRYKPPIPIIAVTRYEQLSRQLHLYRGVFPILYPVPEDDLHWHADIDKRINYGIKRGKARGWIHSGDFIVLITGWRKGAGFSNTVRLITAA